MQKLKTFNPVMDQYGRRVFSEEKFEYKVVFIFEDKLTIYKSAKDNAQIQNTEVDENNQKNLSEDKIELKVLLAEINLDCGGNSSYLCTLEEYTDLKANTDGFEMEKKVEEGSRDFQDSRGSRCLILPVIAYYRKDNSFEDKNQSNIIYICEPNAAKTKLFYVLKFKLSRLILQENARLTKDTHNALNSLPRMSGKFYISDKSAFYLSTFDLRFNKMVGFYPGVISIDSYYKELVGLRATPLASGLLDQSVPEDWKNYLNILDEKQKTEIPDDECCFYIPYPSQGENPGGNRYFCSFIKNDGNDSADDPKTKCEETSKSFINYINQRIEFFEYLNNFTILDKTQETFQIKEKSKESKEMVKRLKETLKYVKNQCSRCRSSAQLSNAECAKWKEDEMQQEVRFLRRSNLFIQSALEKESVDLINPTEESTDKFRFLSKNHL